MGKIISVWGTPFAGKTTIAAKLAKEIYEKHHASVILLLTDNAKPLLPVFFPQRKETETFSLGEVLAKPEIREADITKGRDTYASRGCRVYSGRGEKACR